MSSTVEATVIEALQEALGVPVYGATPEKHDDAFVTVEALGGSYGLFRRARTFTVSCWAESFEDAAELAAECDGVLLALAFSDTYPTVCDVSMDSGSETRDIDPDTGQARYSTRVEVTEST